MPEPTDDLIDAIGTAADLARDNSLPREAGNVYRTLSAELHQALASAGTPRLAWASLVVRPEIRTDCFTVITDTAVVVGWRSGLIKKKSVIARFALDALQDRYVGPGDTPATR